MQSTFAKTCTQNLKTVLDRFSKEHWAVSSVLLWSGFVCVATALYLIFGINRWDSLFLGIIALLGVFFVLKNKRVTLKLFSHDLAVTIPLLVTICTDFLLLYAAWHTRTDAALRSPWEQIGLWFFIVYGCTTAILAGALYKKQPTLLSFLGIITHIGLFYGIALAAFRFGYAYDPLIHQAAENYITEHGRILPIQPFYIGQYALVTVSHFVTGIPIWIIDRLLVPLLATISLPTIGYIGLTHGWKIPREHGQLATLGLLVYPIAEFTFTVPHNLTVLFLLWWLLLVPCALQTKLGQTAISILSIATFLIHPLIGAPLCIATVCALLLSRKEWRSVPIAGAACTGAALLFMLGVYRLQHNATFVRDFSFSNFVSVFEFHYTVTAVRPILQLLYGYNFLLLYALLAIGIIAAKKFTATSRATRWSIFSLMGGILIGIFLISSFISLPGVNDYEQNEFVLRLHAILPIIALPFIIYGAYRVAQKNPFMRPIIILCLGAASAVSLYFSYPRTDGAMRPGWNVSRGDLDLVHSLPKLSNGSPYLLLSNQILAVTGLREQGFDNQSHFVIGMNEPQFAAAEKVLYTELNGADMRTLAEQIHGSVFIGVQDYWYRADEIKDEARIAGADQTYRFDGITMYEFR